MHDKNRRIGCDNGWLHGQIPAGCTGHVAGPYHTPDPNSLAWNNWLAFFEISFHGLRDTEAAEKAHTSPPQMSGCSSFGPVRAARVAEIKLAVHRVRAVQQGQPWAVAKGYQKPRRRYFDSACASGGYRTLARHVGTLLVEWSFQRMQVSPAEVDKRSCGSKRREGRSDRNISAGSPRAHRLSLPTH